MARFDHLTAGVLVDGGADQDLELPDGGTPLLRAVDTGSPTLVYAVLGKEPRLRLPEASRRELLDLARYWHETGVVEELRRRTGAAEPAVMRRVDDPEGDTIDEFSLGGRTVRDGHGAVLTHLEWAFDVFPPLDEVMARAVPHAQDGDSNWFAAAYYLGRRRGPRIWSGLASLRHHPDPLHRRFLAQVFWHRNLLATVDRAADVAQDVDFLASWAQEEPDGQVLAAVLDIYTGHGHPEQEAIGLRYIGHPDPSVRSEAVFCVGRERAARSDAAASALLGLVHDPEPEVRASVAQVFAQRFTPDKRLEPAVRDALLVLVRDETLWVRRRAAESLSDYDDRSAPVLDAFLALLDEEDKDLRLEAAWALARRDHPRTEEAYERVGPLDAFSEYDHRTSGIWHYRASNRSDQA
ncbi:HEAT repeat domain-containing protein [Streptomyces sp. NRRL S-495]|uniref:HEAT repeat domain-containing protein n=1 Tax=Streptomyces sp. NRRL S-495 TaxID=1609133 RepID=UPI0025709284|nr:HEAT repeat domain-containing protein [Streptomyces sp. NRRL S-495]